MNGSDVITYMEKHELDLLMDFYSVGDVEAYEMDCYAQYSQDPDFRQFVEESLSESYYGMEAKEDSLRGDVIDGSLL